jgi:hypothetical protein
MKATINVMRNISLLVLTQLIVNLLRGLNSQSPATQFIA